jgi:hypothetical protein
MTLSIPDAVSVQPGFTPAPAPTAIRQVQQSQSSDTVEVSQAAQVSQLNQRGQTPAEIAKTLGMAISLVNLDLGIFASNVLPASTAVPAAGVPTTAAPTTVASTDISA